MDWRILLTTFTALFIAELGDKTQLAVISLASKHQAPVPVFLGAVAALSLVTLVGVAVGQALSYVLPVSLLHKAAATLFVVLGLLMWFEVL
jgi:putative Ca2+/H+ antiporter (TMEM165/GDT1 family)